MPPDATVPAPVQFFGLSSEGFNAFVARWDWPAFRADQVRDWAYRKLVADPHRMTNLSKLDRERLNETVQFAAAQITRRQDSSDGTRKLLLTWSDGANAETVMIPDADRRTACVSSQVGCPVQCKFCASGIGGVKGNLSAGQIVEQIFALNKVLEPRDERITNIVFMGMGEPLANFTQLTRAIRIIQAPWGLGIGARHITVSTSGLAPQIKKLADFDIPVRLAISFHGATDEVRERIMPVNLKYPIAVLMEALAHWSTRRKQKVTLEYILIEEVNDQPEHAVALARRAKAIQAKVNLIPYNTVPGLPWKRPSERRIEEFADVLKKGQVTATVRREKGHDIDAACGQLRLSELNRQKPQASAT
jgi:23S rRNA (adenine2503-C2)-methyltransferase